MQLRGEIRAVFEGLPPPGCALSLVAADAAGDEAFYPHGDAAPSLELVGIEGLPRLRYRNQQPTLPFGDERQASDTWEELEDAAARTRALVNPPQLPERVPEEE